VSPTVVALVLAGITVLLALWAIQVRTRDAATADVGWTILVAGGAIAAGVLGDGDPMRRTLVSVLAATWALRLGFHLLRDRVFAGRGEDGRYAALREHWGGSQGKFLLLYLAQAVVAAIFIAPLVAAMRGGPLDAWAFVGLAIWVLAVAGEWMADAQLARFRADASTKGQVCRVGLWRYSRHPNYFFEWLHWVAYVAIGHAALLTLVGPAAMLLFLFHITGIPYTERQALRSRGDAYREYQRTTSIFLPLPPRRAAAAGDAR
jgi:steroid 5-alpha reductase family enzyme